MQPQDENRARQALVVEDAAAIRVMGMPVLGGAALRLGALPRERRGR
jgi:hypothetical protein